MEQCVLLNSNIKYNDERNRKEYQRMINCDLLLLLPTAFELFLEVFTSGSQDALVSLVGMIMDLEQNITAFSKIKESEKLQI